jgi:hypothetical protein
MRISEVLFISLSRKFKDGLVALVQVAGEKHLQLADD